jgi:hypothetical protein
LTACIEKWPQLNGGIRYQYLVDYHSYTGFGTYSLTNEEWDNREMIYNFKNNSELTDPISHKIALDKAIDLVLPLLRNTFGEELKKLTLVCIPASTAEQTAARFEEFARRVTEATGMTNGYDHITVVADKDGVGDSHLPEYAIDNEFFAERKVLLFDDIMVTGGSVNKFATRLTEAGIDIVAAVILGKTVAKKQIDE